MLADDQQLTKIDTAASELQFHQQLRPLFTEGKLIDWLMQLPHRVWISLLATLVVLVIGQLLFSGHQIISHPSTDIANQFLFSREFGFKEMRHGDFPLWNPFTYGGTPYLGQFQSALLYPFNLILFLTLPIGQALNWSVALHVFLLGVGVYFWLVYRQISRPASFLGGVALMFGGPFFLHTYAGHLSNLCSMAWVPFLFLCIDGWLKERHGKWILFASLCVALQIYGGHPQYVYYTGIVAAIYAAVYSMGIQHRHLAIGGLLCIYPLAALLSAAQLWPGIRAAEECSRSGGVNYAFASMFSFPLENLLTFIAPWFFGDMRSIHYWGHCYLWEMQVYMGIGVLLFAIWGAIGLYRQEGRQLWRPLLLLGVTLIFAFGRHVPFLYDGMYHAVPFYNSFRGTSKFLFFFAFFAVFFAACGFDRLLRGERPTVTWGKVVGGSGVILIILSLVLSAGTVSEESWWQWVWNKMASSGEYYLPQSLFTSADVIVAAKEKAAHSLAIGGLILSLFGIAMAMIKRWPEMLWLVGVGAIVEVAVFAHNTVIDFPLREAPSSVLAEVATQLPADSRVLNMMSPDASLALRTEGIWGYDPFVLKRYAQLLAYSQGVNPGEVTQNLSFNRAGKILELLRCTKVFIPTEKGIQEQELSSDFPRFFLAGHAILASGREEVFSAIERADLRNQVVLEKWPQPAPAESTPVGYVKVLKNSNHCWRLKVRTDRPALLVNTDAWSVDWRAKALPGSVQKNYQVLPADYAIRAVPLEAGLHFLELNYWPRAWGWAILVSVLTLLGVSFLLGFPKLYKRLQL